MASKRTVVLCLEGAHGSGKSTLSQAFVEAGYEVLGEGFMAQPDWATALHPQSLVMEVQWVGDWVERVMRLHHEPVNSSPSSQAASSPRDQDAVRVVIADRSPFSAVFYARNKGELLDPLIRAQLQELSECGVHVVTVLVTADEETHWQRVAARLHKEPERAKYNEGSREWFDCARGWYETFGWDARVDNSGEEISDAFGMLESALQNFVASGCEDGFTIGSGADLSHVKTGAESPACSSLDEGSPGPVADDEALVNDVRGFHLSRTHPAPVPPPAMVSVATP